MGLLCIQECLEDRPKMPYVLLMLSINLGRLVYQGDVDNEVQINLENESSTHNSISTSLQDYYTIGTFYTYVHVFLSDTF